MDRNLAGETSFRFSPTLTETASTELLKIQRSIDVLKTEMHQQNAQANRFEEKVDKLDAEVGAMYQTTLVNIKDIAKDINSIQYDIQVIYKMIFRVLTLFPIRILNWFKCFAELLVCESTVKYKGKDVHAVMITIHPLDRNPNNDKKIIRSMNKESYRSLARIKKAEKKPLFKITISMF